MTEFLYSNTNTVFPSQIVTDRLVMNRVDESDETPRSLYEKLNSESALIAKPDTYPVSRPKTIMSIKERYFDESANNEQEGVSYIMQEQNSDEFIGICAVFPSWECKRMEMGLWLDSEYWGNEYSGERGEAMLQLAFTELDFEYMRVRTSPSNTNAQSAVKHLGVKPRGFSYFPQVISTGFPV